MGYQDSGNRSCAFHSGNLNSNTVNVKNNMLILHAATFPCLYQNHWIRNTQYPPLTKTVFHNARKQGIDRTANLILKPFFNL